MKEFSETNATSSWTSFSSTQQGAVGRRAARPPSVSAAQHRTSRKTLSAVWDLFFVLTAVVMVRRDARCGTLCAFAARRRRGRRGRWVFRGGERGFEHIVNILVFGKALGETADWTFKRPGNARRPGPLTSHQTTLVATMVHALYTQIQSRAAGALSCDAVCGATGERVLATPVSRRPLE